MRFEWDEDKARANVQKHGVSFEEARTVFFEEDALLYDDPDHSADEDRFLLVGPSAMLRIISARRATRRERRSYVAQRSR